jgi:hypothetical protein
VGVQIRFEQGTARAVICVARVPVPDEEEGGRVVSEGPQLIGYLLENFAFLL